MKRQDKSISKKRFLGLFSVGILGAIFGRDLVGQKKVPNNDKVKMLTPEGDLVEVDRSMIDSNKKQEPISNARMKKWIESKQ